MPSAIVAPQASFIAANDYDGSEVMAALEYHAGRVVLLTDINAFDGESTFDNVVPEPGSPNAVVWENMFDWAAGDGE